MSTHSITRFLMGAQPSQSLDEELEQLCRIYGFQAVQNALKKQNKVKRGRKPEEDGPLLAAVAKADAAAWMEGRNPFEERNNWQIANAYAKEAPGHNFDSTLRRILRKLSERRGVGLCANLYALQLDMTVEQRQRLTELAQEVAPAMQEIWQRLFSETQMYLERYRAKFGEPQLAAIFRDLVKHVMAAEMSEAPEQPQPRGLLDVPSDKMSSE